MRMGLKGGEDCGQLCAVCGGSAAYFKINASGKGVGRRGAGSGENKANRVRTSYGR